MREKQLWQQEETTEKAEASTLPVYLALEREREREKAHWVCQFKFCLYLNKYDDLKLSTPLMCILCTVCYDTDAVDQGLLSQGYLFFSFFPIVQISYFFLLMA